MAATDTALQQAILSLFRAYQERVAGLFAAPPPPVGAVRMTDRIAQLYPRATFDHDDLFRIGKAAAALHLREYGHAPPRQWQRVGQHHAWVNLYTLETTTRTLDRAIHGAFGAEEDASF